MAAQTRVPGSRTLIRFFSPVTAKADERGEQDMIVVFAGPSLCGLNVTTSNFTLCPPIRRGDIDRLLKSCQPLDGICIIDGFFHQTLSVSHGEILRALQCDIPVYGCSSMGALRAVELENYGMQGFGWVYSRYRRHPSIRDDEVALIHDPDPPYTPVSDALVNIVFGVTWLVRYGLVSARLGRLMVDWERTQFYAYRSFRALPDIWSLQYAKTSLSPRVTDLLRHGRELFDIKRLDAVRLLLSLGHEGMRTEANHLTQLDFDGG